MKKVRVYTPKENEEVKFYDMPDNVLSSFVDIEVEDSFDTSDKKAIIAEDGTVSFEQDSVKIQKKRDLKLMLLRSMRNQKLQELDILINDIALGVSSLLAADLVEYRQSLKDFTDTYKYVNDSNKAKAIIDDLDLENIAWPTL